MSKLEQSQIDDAKASDIVTVIENYGIKLEKAGSEYKAICPFHSESSPSFSVTPNKNRYHCFGCGANGDPIQFVQEYAGVSFREAVNQLNGTSEQSDVQPRAPRVIERDDKEAWTPMSTVPDNAPLPMDKVNRKIDGKWHSLAAARRWSYLNGAGELIGYIYRFNLPQGGKEVVPQTYCTNSETGEIAWRWMSFTKPRPIYGLELLASNPTAQVLAVEGEKDCDAARELFAAAGVSISKLIVVSWPGGGKAIKHVNWAPLAGRKLCLWPDADQKPYVDTHPRAGELMPFDEQPGTVAMRSLYEAVKDHCDTVKFVHPPAGVPDGWGLADELPAGFNLIAHMKTAILAAEQFAVSLPTVEPDDGYIEMPPPWEGEEVVAAEPTPAPKPAPKKEKVAPPAKKLVMPESDEEKALSNNGYFRILGYDHDRYYILQHEKSQIMVYTKGDFSESGLIELAPLNWWEENFAIKGKLEKKMALNWIVRKAASRGIYDLSRIRGRGAWTDKGRSVFHHGGFLTVDGVYTEITDFESHYVYEKNRSLPEIADTALTDEEGRDLLDIAAVFRWAKPASAALLTGFVALAPLCGAIRWRPHIWLNGGAGSGKSTVLNDYVHLLLNGMDLYAQGNSSEAGIRQELKGDALPVLFDESESNNDREAMRIQSVLSLIRQASTESQARTLKGTAGGDAMSFHIRSMFCLASIQVGIKYQADIERMTVLSLLPKRDDPNAADTWKRISEALYTIKRDDTLPARLVKRSLNLLPITLKNISTFSEACALRFGSQRDGDQYGTLMAGAWSMISSELVDLDGALGLIDSYDWSEHRENNEVDEGERALSALMGALIRISGNDVSVNELVRIAYGYEVDGVTLAQASAEAMLQRHGMRLDGKNLILSNTSVQLRSLMAGTPFEADLRGVLLRVRGATRYEKSIKFSGVTSRAIMLPIDNILTDDIIGADGAVQF